MAFQRTRIALAGEYLKLILQRSLFTISDSKDTHVLNQSSIRSDVRYSFKIDTFALDVGASNCVQMAEFFVF